MQMSPDLFLLKGNIWPFNTAEDHMDDRHSKLWQRRFSICFLPVRVAPSGGADEAQEFRFFHPGPHSGEINSVNSAPTVFSVKHISRHLWYPQRVQIKAESLSTSCSAYTRFPWQLRDLIWILLFFLWSFLSRSEFSALLARRIAV